MHTEPYKPRILHYGVVFLQFRNIFLDNSVLTCDRTEVLPRTCQGTTYHTAFSFETVFTIRQHN